MPPVRRRDRWIKTVRNGEGDTFPACDPCWLANRDGMVIVPGPITVTARCDECLTFMNPRELAVRRGLVRKRYVGICVTCAGCTI